MYEKIVVASDLSEAANHVINSIQDLKKFGTREVILFHALGIRHFHALQYDLARFAEPALAEQEELLRRSGFSVKVAIGPDGVVRELQKVVEEEKASLVVIGTHGRGMAFDALIGGQAHKIMHSATFPLLVIRLHLVEETGKLKSAADCLSFSKKILYVTDFSETAQRAFSHLEKMVELGIKRISLLHVQDRTKMSSIEKHLPRLLDEFDAIDTQRLERLKNSLTAKGAQEVDVLLKHGMPVAEILKVSKDDDYSFILMGSQGRGYVKESFLGSVSNNVVRQASLPVLLIPALRG
ncbi:MAG: putative universal stress protein [Syntrophus sp. PtaB.Bin075]|nr:MAG: putative universal stress protein [Syntrophus sp. PtaB.Bin075]